MFMSIVHESFVCNKKHQARMDNHFQNQLQITLDMFLRPVCQMGLIGLSHVLCCYVEEF